MQGRARALVLLRAGACAASRSAHLFARTHRMTQKTSNSPAAPRPAPSDAVAEFLARADALTGVPPSAERSRLVFALDATMSRQPTWDLACKLQGEMFAETARIGGLDVQLVYFRGLAECKAS